MRLRHSLISLIGIIVAAILTLAIACGNQTDQGQVNQGGSPATSQSAVTQTHKMPGSAAININTAILSELDKLEAKLGIPALSHRIQAGRPYGSPDELVAKKVLTQEQFDQIKDLVTVEDIVLTGEAKDVDYFLKLALMKGHMLVAKELLDLKKPDQAEPHIGHPVEEIYVDLEDQLQERKVTAFKEPLSRLQDLVKSKPNDPKIATEYTTAMAGIDQAIQVLPVAQRQSSPFVLQVINGLLDTASSEYTAAISNGKFTERIEYQDSRGFVIYAQTLYSSIEKTLVTKDPKANDQIKTSLSELAKAWPTPIPPAAPLITSDQLAGLVQQIQLKTQPLITASATP